MVFCVFEVKFCGRKIDGENFGTGTEPLKYGACSSQKLSDLHVKLSSYGILPTLNNFILEYEIK